MCDNLIPWIIIGAFLFAIFCLLLFMVVETIRHRKRVEQLTLYQINVTSQIDSSIPEILDLIIQESFNDYQVKSLLALEEGYINTDREAEIRKDLVAMVTKRISNAALDKISLFYNIANIADIIADKIYIIVMNYAISHNSKFVDTKPQETKK